LQEEKSIKELMHSLFKSYNQGDKYEEVSLLNSWEKVVGKVIAQKTKKVFINKKVLYLTLTSAPLKNELRYHKLVLIEKINTYAKKDLIIDIQFYS
jgi:predicted nucleic acid-binding Zn ribbon protein